MPAVMIEKIGYSHDAMIDALIAQPGVTQGALAAMFGYTQAWVSTVMASDAFKERLAKRRKELIDPSITASVEERFRALTERSLAVLQEKLSVPTVAISDDLALKAAALGAKGLNVGGFGGVKVEMAASPISSEDRLKQLADRLTGFIHAKRVEGEGHVIEAEVVGETGSLGNGAGYQVCAEGTGQGESPEGTV